MQHKLITFEVYGMSCIGCTNTVKTALMKYPGMHKADVELMPPEATVLCDENIIPHDLMKFLENNSHYTALVKVSPDCSYGENGTVIH